MLSFLSLSAREHIPTHNSLTSITFFEHQVDNQLVVTPYPALLYPITEALPPRHAAVNRSAAPSFPSLPLRRGVGSSLAGVESDQVCGVYCEPTYYVLAYSLNQSDVFFSLLVRTQPPTIHVPSRPPTHPPTHPVPCSARLLHPTSSRAASCCVVLGSWLGLQTCFEAILHRDLGYSWVNFVRLASVRLAPLDVNIDMALVDALLEVSARVIDLVEVSGCVDTQGNHRKKDLSTGLRWFLVYPHFPFSIAPRPPNRFVARPQYHATMLTPRRESHWAALPLYSDVFAIRASTTVDLQPLPPPLPGSAHNVG